MPEPENAKLKIRCPFCASKLDVTDLKPFMVFPCPKCGYKVTVPMRFQTYVLEEYLESNGGIHRYRALDEKLDREVCVVICEASDTHPWEQLEHYLDWVRKVSAISHPGLATIYSCGCYENGVYVASQLLSEPVRDNVLADRMNWREAKPLLLSLAEALQKAAEAGVPHGALNGKSFRMDAAGVPKVCDFGEGLLLTGHLADDPYAAPERKAGGECSVASDLFSFGVWAFGLLTGCSPHDAANGVILDDPADVPAGVPMVLRQMTSASVFQRPNGYLPVLKELVNARQAVSAKRGKRGLTLSSKDCPIEQKSGGTALGVVLCMGALLLAGMGGWAFWKWQENTQRADLQNQAVVMEKTTETADDEMSSLNNGNAKKTTAEEALKDESKIAPLPSEFRRFRPKPGNLKFDEEKIREYLSKLPAKYVAAETDRARRMMGLREYLFASLRMPYRPPESNGLRLRDGSLLRGFIPMGTEEHGLTVRPFDDARQSLSVMNLKIEDLDWSEIWSMLDYYGKIREDMADSQIRASVFEHYLNSAVACDWYGYREEASSFIHQALKINPNGKPIIEKLGFENKKTKDEKR